MPYKSTETKAEYNRRYYKRKKTGAKLTVAQAIKRAGKPPLSKRTKMSEAERKERKAIANHTYYLKRKGVA
jgi:hypothetical protein